MTQPLVATKLHIPTARPALVTRRRLLRLLDVGAATRLTLISAPAGFGKTTLLAEWLAQTRTDWAVAWLSLDAADSDPALLWRGVVTALHGARWAEPEEPSEKRMLPLAMTDVSVPVVLNYLGDMPCEVLLVLDDYHVAGRADVAAGMSYFVEHLPPNAHLVLSTRADPELALARWRARGELVEVRAQDLRFTPDETATYLHQVSTTTLTRDQVGALERRTEGWIAALQLAAISLHGRADVSEFIEGFAGDNRFVVDFLVEEVLTRQLPQVRDFLLRSSVLDRFGSSLCDAVLDRVDSEQMLRTLERANLFLVALDDRRGWYRYHQLFADVLRARLRSEHPELISVLHERASHWFEQQDLADPAIRHSLAAGNVHRAAALIEAAIPAVRRNRQEAMARSWLKELPEHVIAGSPSLAVLAAGLALVGGDLTSVSTRLDQAERGLAAQAALARPPAEGPGDRRWLLATVAIYRASLAQAHADTEATVRHAQRARELASPEDHLSHGAAAGFLGLAAWAQGEVRQALDTFGAAVQHLHAAGNLVDEFSGTVVLADLWRAAGRPQKARELCERALGTAEAADPPFDLAIVELHVALAELDIEAGELIGAEQHLDTAERWSPRAVLAESISRQWVAKALLARARGDFAAAHGHLDQAEQHYRPGFHPDLRPIHALRTRFRICEGDLQSASEWARERRVSVDAAPDHLHEFDLLTLARLLLADQREAAGRHTGGGDVLGLLHALHEAAEASGRTGALVEIGMLMALALDTHGQRTAALTMLASTWQRANEPRAYVRLYLDEGPPMLRLLQAGQGDPVVGQNARHLLAIAAASPAAGLQRSRASDGQLSDREIEVLGLLGGELSGPAIAKALYISPNTLRTHTKHIFTKLEVSSRRAAVVRARERRLLPPTG